jgi:DNA-binding CsgD family transcriptional regulator
VGPALRAIVSPLSAGAGTHALVVINDPAAMDPGRVADLRAFYGLSHGEAETAVALARGLAPADVAASRGVALATVRTQIRLALRKMEARGIPELVALVASVPVRPS